MTVTSWTGREQVSGSDIQQRMVWLLDRYRDSCAATSTTSCSSSSESGPWGRSPRPDGRLHPRRV